MTFFRDNSCGNAKRVLAIFGGLAISLSGLSSTAVAASQLGMAESFNHALKNDSTLAIARAQNLSDKEAIPQAQARLLPSLSLTGNYTVADYQKTGVTASPVKSGVAKLNVMQPLYNKRLLHTRDRAALSVDVSDQQLQGVRQDLAIGVIEHYLAVILAKSNLTLFEAETESYRHQWEKVKAALELGLTSRADVLDAEARNDEGMSRVLIAKRELERERFALQRRTGLLIDPLKLKDLPTKSYMPEPYNSEEWLKKIATGNITIKLATGNLTVAQEDVRIERSDHYPTLNMQAGLSYTNNDDSSAVQDRDARVSLVFELPLYQGGYVNSRVRQAHANKNRAQETLRDVQQSRQFEARQLLFSLETGRANIDVLRLAINARQKSLEAAEESRKLGLKDLSDVLDVQARLYQTSRELSKAIHDDMLNRSRLEAIAGSLTLEKLRELDSLLDTH